MTNINRTCRKSNNCVLSLQALECLQVIYSVGLSAIHVDAAEQNCMQQPGRMTVAGKELVSLLTKQGALDVICNEWHVGMSGKVGRSRRL